jgi:PAS domain S-box-containing protein/putative nucleotidyltransferase with HDIG domain
MDTTEQMKTEYELQLHKLCFDRAPIGIFRVGTDARVLAANDQACSSLGYTPDELRGMSIFAIKPDITPEMVEEYLREMHAAGSITFEAFHRRKDGTRFPVEIWMSPIEFQEYEHRYCFVHDISRRKQAEEALRRAHEELESRVRERTREITDLNEKLTREIQERIRVEEELHRSRKMLQLVMDNIPQRVFWKGSDLRYLGCNQSFAEHAGLRDPSEIVGRDDTQMPWKADAEAYQAQDREIMEHNRVTLGYLSAQTQPDDRVLWLRKNKLPLHDRDGMVIGVLGTFQDITESKRIQQTLTKKETILAEAQSIAQLGSWEYCLETDREYRSLEFFRILGIPAETSGFARDSMFDYVHPLDRERVRSRITETLEHGEPYDVEYRIIRSDGVERHVHAKGKTVADEYDRTTKFIGTIQDITERKQTEEALLFTQFSVDQAAMPIFWIERDGRFAYCNHACSYLGYSPEHLASLTIFDIDPELSQEQWERDWTRCTEKEVVIYESGHRTSQGAFIPVQLTATYMENRGHEYYVAFVKDISRRKRAEEKTAIQLQRLASLRAIDMAITGSLDLCVVLGVILDQVTRHFGAAAADVLILNQAYLLEYAARRGFRTEVGKKCLRLSRDVAGDVVRERRTIHISDMRDQEEHWQDLSRQDEGFITYYGAPLIAKGKVVGVLEIYYRCQRTLEQDEVDFLETLAGQTAIAIDNATLFTGLQTLNTELTLAYDSTLEGWSRALDLRDKESEGHSRRVTELTVSLARAMGIRDSELIHIRRGAMLHDIGKMGIPDNILLKPGSLDAEERAIMEKHPVYAFEFLSSTEFLQQALNIPYCHHERWDGTGYPRRLIGEQIPLAARIFAVVDVWDALCSDRPYRKAWTKEKSRRHILERSGTHFDPAVVEAFMKIIDDFPCALGGGM